MIGQSYSPALKKRATTSKLAEQIADKYLCDFGVPGLQELKSSTGSDYVYIIRDICFKIEDAIASGNKLQIDKKALCVSIMQILFKELSQLDIATINRSIDLIVGEDGKGVRKSGRALRIYRFLKNYFCVPNPQRNQVAV